MGQGKQRQVQNLDFVSIMKTKWAEARRSVVTGKAGQGQEEAQPGPMQLSEGQ